jgi:NitT/TauT family transport system substrate-binding protein
MRSDLYPQPPGRKRSGRPTVILASGTAVLALALAACGSSSSSSPTKAGASKALPTITVAVASGDVTPIPNGILQLGVKTGDFEKLGVKVKLKKLQGSAQTVQALVAGEADVANVDSADAIKLTASKQLPVKAINSSGANPDYVMVVRKDIAGVSDLAGKTFASEQPGSQPVLLLDVLLKQNKVDPTKVKVLSLGKPLDRILAVVNDRADGTIVSNAQWQSLTAKQAACCKLQIDEGAFIKAAPLEAKVNVATPSTISKKRVALQAFTTALIELSRKYYADPKGWASEVAAARSDLTLAALDTQSTTASFKEQWCVNGCMSTALLTDTSDFLYAGSSTLEGVPKIGLDVWTDPSFVATSLKKLGTSSSTDIPAS